MITLHADEELVKKIRRHWFVLFEKFFALLIVYLLPFGLYAAFVGAQSLGGYDVGSVALPELPPQALIFAAAAWSLLLWMKAAGIWTHYYLDMWIITNKRLVDVEQYTFFHREISTLRAEQIQDVTVETKGFLATVLNFGDIHVQSAAASREFTIRDAARPHRVKELILEQHHHALEKPIPVA